MKTNGPEPNAKRLVKRVAASDDMYEALKRSLEFIEDAESCADGPLEVGNVVRAALKKAEGR